MKYEGFEIFITTHYAGEHNTSLKFSVDVTHKDSKKYRITVSDKNAPSHNTTEHLIDSALPTDTLNSEILENIIENIRQHLQERLELPKGSNIQKTPDY